MLAVVLVLALAAFAWSRTWTDGTGKHKTEGEFAKLADGQVVIRRNDGKLVRGGFQGHSTNYRRIGRPSAYACRTSIC